MYTARRGQGGRATPGPLWCSCSQVSVRSACRGARAVSQGNDAPVRIEPSLVSLGRGRIWRCTGLQRRRVPGPHLAAAPSGRGKAGGRGKAIRQHAGVRRTLTVPSRSRSRARHAASRRRPSSWRRAAPRGWRRLGWRCRHLWQCGLVHCREVSAAAHTARKALTRACLGAGCVPTGPRRGAGGGGRQTAPRAGSARGMPKGLKDSDDSDAAQRLGGNRAGTPRARTPPPGALPHAMAPTDDGGQQTLKQHTRAGSRHLRAPGGKRGWDDCEAVGMREPAGARRPRWVQEELAGRQTGGRHISNAGSEVCESVWAAVAFGGSSQYGRGSSGVRN